MVRLTKLVAAMMILAIISLFSAPLLACEAAGHRCAMMSHMAEKPATHACCHGKGSNTPKPAKQHCDDAAVVMPAECAASTSCCDMGNTPVASVTQAEPVKRTALAILIDPPPDPVLLARGHVDRSTSLPFHPRPVCELKTDLRI